MTICSNCGQELIEANIYLCCTNCNSMFINSDSLQDTVDELLDTYNMERSDEAQRLGEQVADLQD